MSSEHASERVKSARRGRHEKNNAIPLMLCAHRMFPPAHGVAGIDDGGYDCNKHKDSESACNSAKQDGSRVCKYDDMMKECSQFDACMEAFSEGDCKKAGGCEWNGSCMKKMGGGDSGTGGTGGEEGVSSAEVLGVVVVAVSCSGHGKTAPLLVAILKRYQWHRCFCFCCSHAFLCVCVCVCV